MLRTLYQRIFKIKERLSNLMYSDMSESQPFCVLDSDALQLRILLEKLGISLCRTLISY